MATTIYRGLCSLIGIAYLVVASGAHAANCGPWSNYGRLQRIGHDQYYNKTWFRLQGGRTDAVTGGGYYLLSNTNKELYAAQVNLIVEAAKAGWIVYVETTNCFGSPPTNGVTITSLFVDF